MARAAEITQDAASKTRDAGDLRRVLQGGGLPLEMLKIALMANGGPLECAALESEEGATYRLTLSNDVVTLERARAESAFEPVPNAEI